MNGKKDGSLKIKKMAPWTPRQKSLLVPERHRDLHSNGCFAVVPGLMAVQLPYNALLCRTLVGGGSFGRNIMHLIYVGL